MRNELEIIESIEKYLKGEMTDAEKKAFETRLETDAGLKEKLELQKQLIKGIERFSLKQQASKAFKKYKSIRNMRNWGMGGLTLAVVATALVYFSISQNPSGKVVNNSLPELNEAGTKLWSDADKYLPGQLFKLDPLKDTVIETSKGILFSIPANCFLDANGKPVTGIIDLEVKEAMDAASIIKSGLSSKSGDQLLESAGMFYLNGRNKGESLKIDPNNAIYAQVPAKETKPNMHLFEGKRMANGSIDWVDPKPLANDLVPVDIHALDFYPPNYKDSLAGMEYDVKNKKFVDSLYYSFAGRFPVPGSPAGTPAQQADTFKVISSGEKLFRQNCAVCHSLGRNKVTGPGLEGVVDRVPSKNWLFRFIKNNKELIKSGDAYANKIYRQYGSEMTIFDFLSETDIKKLIDFIGKQYPKDSTSSELSENALQLEDGLSYNGLNPAKVKAIWTDNFKNTIIATKEFEKRLKAMHALCSNADQVLDLYVNNLDKPLYIIDSMAASRFNEPTFHQFALLHEGGVKINNRQTEALKKYYEVKYKAFAEAETKTRKTFLDEQDKLNQQVNSKQIEQSNADNKRFTENFQKEYKINLKEAYRQLGKPYVENPPAPAYYGFPVTTPGWKNVDAYVWESIVNRETLNYTDPETGKKAVIKYEPFSVKVSNRDKYDRIVTYLLPDKLNSFMRMEETDGVFKEKMNELIGYQLICVGFKSDDMYMYSADAIKPGDKGSVELVKTDQHALDEKLNRVRSMNPGTDFGKEMAYQKFEQKEIKRQEKLASQMMLEYRIGKVIFPCYVSYPETIMRK